MLQLVIISTNQHTVVVDVIWHVVPLSGRDGNLGWNSLLQGPLVVEMDIIMGMSIDLCLQYSFTHLHPCYVQHPISHQFKHAWLYSYYSVHSSRLYMGGIGSFLAPQSILNKTSVWASINMAVVHSRPNSGSFLHNKADFISKHGQYCAWLVNFHDCIVHARLHCTNLV